MQKCVFICTHFVGSMYSCSFSSFSSAGNLYSREVQVDGEQVAVQVQDTPGVLVSPTPPPITPPPPLPITLQFIHEIIRIF